jgi:thiamine-phosphate diphosphorylase
MGEANRWPRLVVVTSRQRLVARLGAAPGEWPALLRAQIAGALAGGADLVQVREPDLEARALASFVRDVFASVPGSAARVVLNDRVDVARVTGAAGVHLAERSLPIEEAKSLQPSGTRWVVGRSVHDPATAAACASASYLIAGTVLPSRGKPGGWRVLGWHGLAAIVASVPEVPVVAIGGLGPEHVSAVLDSGAVGVAGIGCFLPGPGGDVEDGVREQVHAMRNAFDRA